MTERNSLFQQEHLRIQGSNTEPLAFCTFQAFHFSEDRLPPPSFAFWHLPLWAWIGPDETLELTFTSLAF